MTRKLTIAVLTDVHGNAFALDAVCQEIQAFAPDLILNLGDQVWGQADPARALELQRQLGAVEIRGNNDERLIFSPEQLGEALLPLQHWLRERISEAECQRLASLPTTAQVADGAVLAAHGSLTSSWESLLVGWNGSAYVRRPAEEIEAALAPFPGTEVVVVGHMHREDAHKIGNHWCISVGPVSSQTDGDPRARWTLLTQTEQGWQVDMRRTVYDWEAAAAYCRPFEVGIEEASQWYVQPFDLPMVRE